MNLVDRVQSILLRPKTTWPAIDEEPADAASIYKNYVMILALIPAVASFIGLSLVGIGAFGMSFRVPIVAGLANMIVGYVLSLAMVFVLALIIDAMAPTFEGTRSQIGALKLSAYASTAAFVGGIFSLIPALSVIGALAALYGVYLLYTGLPVLMKCPPDKAIAYTAVVVVCAIVGGFVIAWVLSLLTPSPMRLGALQAVDAVVAMQQLAAAAA
ncbi:MULTISPECIES: Yip1 family protein [unclassified Variovorax]|uniref:Yip1 family protein n=1 Tax=unclassified Variovorax TaxID=663243 RepID=UPI003F46A347